LISENFEDRKVGGERRRAERLLSLAATAICQLMPDSESRRSCFLEEIDGGIESTGSELSRGAGVGLVHFVDFASLTKIQRSVGADMGPPCQGRITRAFAAETWLL